MLCCVQASQPCGLTECKSPLLSTPTLTVLFILTPPSSLQGFLASEGIAEAFRSQSIAVTSPENSSRTFYMIAPSNQERTAWVEAIQHNLHSYRVSINGFLHQPAAVLPCSLLPPALSSSTRSGLQGTEAHAAGSGIRTALKLPSLCPAAAAPEEE